MIKEKIIMRSFLALPLLLGFFPASAISGHLPHYGDKKCGWERNDWKIMKWELRQSKKDPKLMKLAKDAEKIQDQVVARLQGLDEPDYDQLAKDLDRM